MNKHITRWIDKETNTWKDWNSSKYQDEKPSNKAKASELQPQTYSKNMDCYLFLVLIFFSLYWYF